MKILITGAASNIGYQVGIKLAKLGNFVYLTVHHDYELASLKEKIKNEDKFLNLFIDCFCLDLLDEKSWKEIINLDIDCLINNAGISLHEDSHPRGSVYRSGRSPACRQRKRRL